MNNKRDLENELTAARNELVLTQSKSFKMLAKATEERDTIAAQAQQQQLLLSEISSTVGLENPSIAELIEKLNQLVAIADNQLKSKDAAKPPMKGKAFPKPDTATEMC